MAEAEEWVQQDGEWQCVNCGVVFPDGKPKGYDFDRNAVKDLPPNLHSVPFWQERKMAGSLKSETLRLLLGGMGGGLLRGCETATQ